METGPNGENGVLALALTRQLCKSMKFKSICLKRWTMGPAALENGLGIMCKMSFAYVPCSEFPLSRGSSCVIRQMAPLIL